MQTQTQVAAVTPDQLEIFAGHNQAGIPIWIAAALLITSFGIDPVKAVTTIDVDTGRVEIIGDDPFRPFTANDGRWRWVH